MRALEWRRSQTLKGREEKNSFEEGLGGLCPCAPGNSDSGAVWTGAMAPGCAILCSLHRIYGDKVCVEWKSVYFLCVQYLRCKTNARSQGLSRMKTNVLAQHSKSPTSKSSFHKKKIIPKRKHTHTVLSSSKSNRRYAPTPLASSAPIVFPNPTTQQLSIHSCISKVVERFPRRKPHHPNPTKLTMGCRTPKGFEPSIPDKTFPVPTISRS